MGINSCGTTLIDQGLFKNIGAITWDTTVKTSGFSAVSGNGYFCNTTSAAFTVTLPSSPSAGDVVAIADYANTFDTNNVTIGRNGSNIQGSAEDFKASIEGLSITLIYVDGTQGWLSVDAAQASDIIGPEYIVATGGTITTSGDFKIHTFTGPGTFTVSSIGNPVGGPNSVDYLVTAGGGGGGAGRGGGGGAGGFRTSFPSPAGTIPVTVQGYPITVGGGGAGFSGGNGRGSSGTNSVFSSITSAAGGGGDGANTGLGGIAGGSGGGGAAADPPSPSFPGGAGNTPPVSPSQGNNGGASSVGAPFYAAGGGGGASNVGGVGGSVGGSGGNGTASSITGSSVTRAGGGGGGRDSGVGGNGGTGGGGAAGASQNIPGTTGTVNTGGGGGGAGGGCANGGGGGSGIVIIRYKYQ